MLILFASRRTSFTDFRRIHDDRTPHVNPAAGAVVLNLPAARASNFTKKSEANDKWHASTQRASPN
jgi:hypothetical protein